jgi:hypothetical protein
MCIQIIILVHRNKCSKCCVTDCTYCMAMWTKILSKPFTPMCLNYLNKYHIHSVLFVKTFTYKTGCVSGLF